MKTMLRAWPWLVFTLRLTSFKKILYILQQLRYTVKVKSSLHLKRGFTYFLYQTKFARAPNLNIKSTCDYKS